MAATPISAALPIGFDDERAWWACGVLCLDNVRPSPFVALLVVLSWALGTASAQPEPTFRQVGASARVLGCTSWAAIPCDGITQTRLGLTVVDLRFDRDDGISPVAIFQAAARTADVDLYSQLFVGPGVRYTSRGRWIQGGMGYTAWRYGIGPRTLGAGEMFERARPALLAGIGLTTIDTEGEPITIALDGAAALMELEGVTTYQVTASFTRKF